jgi:outer membrane protein insertion porin family
MGNPVLVTERNQTRDDAIGGRNYYLGRAELEIPLGTGARELGLRPSIWADVGALWGVETPVLQDNPTGIQFLDSQGRPLFIAADGTVTIEPTRPDGTANARAVRPGSAIREVFLGNSPTPRITAGIGVNWNSPFGPFRIDFSQTIRKVEGDDERQFTFNVGTQF